MSLGGVGATGSAVLWAVGRERSFGIPGPAGSLTAYRAVLPLEADLLDSASPGAAVNQSGYLERGVPGPKGGKAVWSVSLSTGSILDFLEHLLGRVTKSTPAPGIYRYLFEPARDGADTSFFALLSRSPVLRTWFYGIKLGKLSLAIGDNAEIPVKLEGLIGHGTRMSAPVPHPANAGTYQLGPHLRGALRNPTAGPVHVQVAQLAPLQFKTEQTADAPTFPGPAADVALDGTGEAVWQNLQGADGLDLGVWDENRDPLEILWPGTAMDHAALAVGDVFTFHPPGAWAEPVLLPLAGHQRFTSAHWTVALRAAGSSSAWTPLHCRKGNLDLSWPLSEERGNGSRYPYALLRDGLFAPSLKLERALVDSFFADRAETNARLEANLAFQGRQLTPDLRESIQITFASARIATANRSVRDARAISEEVTLIGETDDTLTPPVTIEITTTRDWSPSE